MKFLYTKSYKIADNSKKLYCKYTLHPVAFKITACILKLQHDIFICFICFICYLFVFYEFWELLSGLDSLV